MSNDDRYNGWANRETWAVALHVNNDEGWLESVEYALGEDAPLSDWQAGDIIREKVEQMLTVDGYAETFGKDRLPASLSRIAEEVGSLWRVDWDELGQSFLEDLSEE